MKRSAHSNDAHSSGEVATARSWKNRPQVGAADETSAPPLKALRCLGVAAFASMNVMMLSVPVWSGTVGDMMPEQRDFFHWLSALIALPAVSMWKKADHFLKRPFTLLGLALVLGGAGLAIARRRRPRVLASGRVQER